MPVLVIIPKGKVVMVVAGGGKCTQVTEKWPNKIAVYESYKHVPRMEQFRASFIFDLDNYFIIKNKYVHNSLLPKALERTEKERQKRLKQYKKRYGNDVVCGNMTTKSSTKSGKKQSDSAKATKRKRL